MKSWHSRKGRARRLTPKMARRKRCGEPIHGWMVIDKAQGIASARVVARVRKFTGAAKAGHGGTLDPLATGLLPIALGEATKTVSLVMHGRKQYRFTVRWGEARDTDDSEGEIVATSPARPEKNDILEALGDFVGDIEQIPPAFSALKVGGNRAYKLARAKQEVRLAPRWVYVERFELLDIPDRDHATFSVSCGKGTYIRGLARDVARKLGSLGHVESLRRTRVGPFTERDAISLDYLEKLGHSSALAGHLLPVESVLVDIPALALTEEQAGCLRNGRAVPLFQLKTKAGLPVLGASPEFLDLVVKGQITACALRGDRLVALVRCEKGRIRPLRVFNF